MTIQIKRQLIDGKIWFELLNYKDLHGYPIFVNVPMLEALQNRGHEIIDMDAEILEAVRNN